MTTHPWEQWDAETQRRMAFDLAFHGAARARLVYRGLDEQVAGYPDGESAGLDLAHHHVPAMAVEIDSPLEAETVERAIELARRAALEHPMNRTPRGTAAGAIYLAALLCNDTITQGALVEDLDVGETALRGCYRELAEHEGLVFESRTGASDGGDGDGRTLPDAVWARIAGLVGGGRA